MSSSSACYFTDEFFILCSVPGTTLEITILLATEESSSTHAARSLCLILKWNGFLMELCLPRCPPLGVKSTTAAKHKNRKGKLCAGLIESVFWSSSILFLSFTFPESWWCYIICQTSQTHSVGEVCFQPFHFTQNQNHNALLNSYALLYLLKKKNISRVIRSQKQHALSYSKMKLRTF